MSGYNGFSKSNNAIEAEEDGKFPVSFIAKKLKLSTDFIKKNFQPSEWHHTSSRFNRTDYYSITEIIEYLEENPMAFQNFETENKKESLTKIYSKVCWIDWAGSRSRPVAYKQELINIEVKFNGKNSYTFLAGKREITKRTGTNGFYLFN